MDEILKLIEELDTEDCFIIGRNVDSSTKFPWSAGCGASDGSMSAVGRGNSALESLQALKKKKGGTPSKKDVIDDFIDSLDY